MNAYLLMSDTRARCLEAAASLGTGPMALCQQRILYKISFTVEFTLTLTFACGPLDFHFEFPVSVSLFVSITLPRTRRRLIHPQNNFPMSMIHNNGISSGPGSKQVRWFLQMMSLYTDVNLPVSARKWLCRICLRESFDRRQDLDRHIQLIHLPCCVYCPDSRCEWRGCRVDELQKHLDQQKCHQNSAEQEYRVYDVKTILDIIRDAESDDSIRKARDLAVDFVRERATELGKPGWLADPWGCSEQRKRRERRTSRE